eukprot:jgi/Tetstr1/440591/TSEL_003075.t1
MDPRPPTGLAAMMRQEFFARGGTGAGRGRYGAALTRRGADERRGGAAADTAPLPPPPPMPASTSGRAQTPSAWEGQHSPGPVTAGNLELGPGLRLKYIGPGNHDTDAAIITSDHPVPADQPIFCFEAEVVSKGAEGFIGVGFARKGVQSNILPGWKDGSYGYHGDDGKIFGGSGRGEDYGPTFTTGDTISCIWCQVNRTISFAKNGMDLGVAFRNVSEAALYPAIGMRTKNEEVLANFGGTPLRSSVHTYKLNELRQTAVAEVEAAGLPLAPWAPSRASLHQLVHAYLQHSGYPGAAAAMAGAGLGCEDVQDSSAHDAEVRARIQTAILAGQVDQAEALIEELAPGMLEAEAEVRFRVRCQKFMEMCQEGDDAATVAYGAAHLSEGGQLFPQGAEMVKDAALMLAFPEDGEDSQSNALRLSYRRRLASVINSALQVRAGRPAHSVLERLLAQLKLALQSLRAEGDLLPGLAAEELGAGLALHGGDGSER